MVPRSFKKLVFELSKLPSVGERSAYRIAYHILNKKNEEVKILADSIILAKESLRWCSFCHGLSDDLVCEICSNSSRLKDQLCVVERPSDIFSLERSGSYRGLYHVLHGSWSPLRGVKPEHLTIDKLIKRLHINTKVNEDPVILPLSELILATSTTIEGDATSLYLADALDELKLNVTRLAQGLPKGGELEYADDMTLRMSFSGRRRI